MKLMFASDIHGSAYYCRKMLEAYQAEEAGRLILLGDILYHGPRNDLPKEYAPKEVIAMLNPMKNDICAVRGNCEAEVDQMVLDFPVMADYALILYGERNLYATHGHIYNENNLPPLKNGDILIHGHTHVLKAEKEKIIHCSTRDRYRSRKKEIRQVMQSWKMVCLRSKDLMERL